MRDCTAINQKNTLLHQFAASLNLNQRRRGFYYFLALLLFFLSRAMRSIAPSGLVAHG